MHECPSCGQACDCDGEDVWNDYAARDCTHDCEEDDWEDDQQGLDACCIDCGSIEIAGTCSGCGSYICSAHAVADGRMCTMCRKGRWPIAMG